jgi:hypothetical protein
MFRVSQIVRTQRWYALVAATVFAGALAGSPSNPAEAIIYEGHPDLSLTASLVEAGGGPQHFSSAKLFAYLAGPHAGPEAAKLTREFGAAGVTDTFAVFDYAIDDALRVATAKGVALPAASPILMHPKELALALYGAGTSGSGKWDVGFMLEHMITHPIHHAVMGDIDAKFGAAKNERFHIALTRLMTDLDTLYGSSGRAVIGTRHPTD